MERRLIVMRHAKSSWDSPANSDHERPLNDRGRHDTPRVADELQKLGWQPQHILSSDAQRTRETSDLLLAHWEEGIAAEFAANLYLAGPRELADELPSLAEEVETLLVLGHNPGWEAVVFQLCGESVPMKTATAALLESAHCPLWEDAFRSEWTLQTVVYPRELID